MNSSALLSSSQALREGALLSVRADQVALVLVRLEGVVYALRDRCPHLGCPLSRGALDGFILTCPCHDWRFDVRDGKFLDASEIAVDTWKVFEENGGIYIAQRSEVI